MIKIIDIVKPRQEVLDDKLQGVIWPYKITDTSRIESDAGKFFDTTFPSNALQNVLDRVNDKLKYKSHRGAFVLQGPRGAGKSHALVTLYHIFESPQLAEKWFGRWNIDSKLPNQSKSIILSTRQVEPAYLWEPIFERAGREDLLEKVDKYPTTDVIEELVGEKTVAIFLDEVESWWNTFKEEDFARERNKFFIENLLNVASDKDFNLFVFIATYGVVEGLEPSFNRTNPCYEDMDASGDKEKVIFHRLFTKPRKDIDETKIRKIVEAYIENYKPPIQLENLKRYQEECVRDYPFHPQLLSVLSDIYEGERGSGSVRGQMNVLADLVAENYKKTDLLLLSDLEYRAFRGIDRELVNKCGKDFEKRTGGIDYGKEILQVILLHSIKGSPASVHDILLGIYKPTHGMSLTQLDMSLNNLYGQAYYLHKENQAYQIKKIEALNALISRERKKVSELQYKDKLGMLLKHDIFKNQVYLYEQERKEISKDAKNLKFVVMLRGYGDSRQLQDEIEGFLHGKMYQNNFVFIVPKNGGPLGDDALRIKIKSICAAENLLENLEDERKGLKKRINNDQNESKNYMINMYGQWVKWGTHPDSGKVAPILINVKPEMIDIREKIRTDKDTLKGEILELLERQERGREIGSLLNDFRKRRKLTLISSSNIFYSVIKELHRDEIMIVGNRAKGFWDTVPHNIQDDWEVIDINFASRPEPETDTMSTPTSTPTFGEGVDTGGRAVRKDTSRPPSVEPTKRTSVMTRRAVGNSPRSILNKYEMIINEDDLENIESINLQFDFSGINKQQLLRFINALPTDELGELITKLEAVVKWTEYED